MVFVLYRDIVIKCLNNGYSNVNFPIKHGFFSFKGLGFLYNFDPSHDMKATRKHSKLG